MSNYQEVDLNKVKTYSIKKRKSKIETHHFGKPFQSGSNMRTFLQHLPQILAGKNFLDLIERITVAVQSKKPVLILMGAHVIKTGLGPILIDLMENGVVQGIAMNGAGAIHDMELAFFGHTSENVEVSLEEGMFGMVHETAALMNETVKEGAKNSLGFGEVLGNRIFEENPTYFHLSLLGQASRLQIPVTVHVALGTDIVHQHGSADGQSIGELSLRDFRIFTHLVSQIHHGGIVLLFGSAVILPEVFLKALSVARNVYGKVEEFTTACFDMNHHYRPQMNVIERPTRKTGRGFYFTGHHELMIPLLAAAIKERMSM